VDIVEVIAYLEAVDSDLFQIELSTSESHKFFAVTTQLGADNYGAFSVKFSADTTVDMLEAFAADQNLERDQAAWGKAVLTVPGFASFLEANDLREPAESFIIYALIHFGTEED